MSIIHILPESVANKIAAGEVVERPGSVVKELVENALDAGAGRVEVSVEAGGKRRIWVRDDGCGMSRDDALLALERHATSKIRSADDLTRISTLGFRGEALPSIAAVSRMVLETREASEAAGTRLEIMGGKLRDVKEVAGSGGTSVEVRDLFFNTPVRRKFLRSESTELGHVASLVTHYALAHPEKSFRLASLTHEILNVAPVDGLRARVYQVLGGKTLEQMVEMDPSERRVPAAAAWEGEGEAEDVPAEAAAVLRVAGFVSRPEVQKPNRNHIYFFVNRRLVRDRAILHALREAYRNILPPSAFPVALVFLELPPGEVDVNVHPSKTEVRLRHSQFIHDLIRDTIRRALIMTRPVAAFPLPKSGEGSLLPGGSKGLARKPMADPSIALTEEQAEVAERLNKEPPGMRGGAHGVEATMESPARSITSSGGGQTTGPVPRTSPLAAEEFRLSSPQPEPRTGTLPLVGETMGLPTVDFAGGSATADKLRHPLPAGPGDPAFAPAGPASASAGVCGTELRVPSSEGGELPDDLQPLGQIQESFIVATNAEGLWIIDQHVAHERVLFEHHLRQRREKRVEVQRLLLPMIVELNPEQQAIFQELADELARNGFEAEPFGQRTVAVKTAPADVPAHLVEPLLLEILDGVGREARTLSLDVLIGKIAASISCHAAIKVNMALDQRKMSWLLRELSKTECPMACPHGRPIVLRYGMREIQKAFKRI